jgi:sterol desaturase/sphingolipid hydroxylase (fatty acid hydroxylase superfamily)
VFGFSDFQWHFDAPEERLYWPYVLASLFLALLVYGLKGRWNDLRAALFSKEIWFHPSARLDYQLFIFRALLSILVGIPSWFSATYVALKISFILFSLSDPPDIQLSKTLWTTIYTVTLFVASDFSRFLLHRAMHTNNFLWRFHQVHHSAEVMTPVTLYRTHPVEGLLVAARGIVVMGFIGGIFAWATRGEIRAFEIAGINALAYAFNFLGSNVRHSHVWISFGWFENFFVSPAQHQLHHGASSGGYNVNYGSFLSLWDRLFSSQVKSSKPESRFGVDGPLNHHPRQLLSVLLGPFTGSAKPPQ